MDRQLYRLETALKALLDHDAAMTTRQMLVFLEVARATDGVEARTIEQHLHAPAHGLDRDLAHFGHVRGPGAPAFHRLIDVRNPPGDRRQRVAFLSREGHMLAEQVNRIMESGA